MFKHGFPPEWSTLKKLLLLRLATSIKEVWKTISNAAIATFTAIVSPLRQLVVAIEPVQSGTGTPSPDNIRPISGWSEAKIWVQPTHDTSAIPTATIDLDGTRYGGTLDVLTGVLTVDRVFLDTETLITKGEGYNQGKNMYSVYNYSNLAPNGASGTVNSAEAISSISDCSLSWNNMTSANAYPGKVGVYKNSAWNYTRIYIYINDAAVTTKAEAETWLRSKQVTVCYKLGTPQTVQLTAQQVSSLAGTNVLFADTGNIVTVEYRES